MTASVKRQTRIYNADNFLEAFREKSPDQPYLFIGRNTAWTSPASDTLPPTPIDNDLNTVADYNEMIALKRVSSSSIIPVIRRFNWVSGEIYGEYSPDITQPFRTWNDVDYPVYVLADTNVYKCIKTARNSLGVPQPSTEKPTVTASNIITETDGYQWKFMFNLSISEIQNFLTDEWIPVKDLYSDDGSPQWDIQVAAVDGGVHRIEIVDGGTGYSVADPIYITSSDGTGFAAEVASVSSGAITGITVTNYGTGYINPNDAVGVTSSGTGADLRVVISPVGGHGSNARDELFGTFVMLFGSFVGTENGNFPIGDDFRTIGLIMNPLLDAVSPSTSVELIITNPTYNDFEPSESIEIVGTLPLITGNVSYWNRNTGQLFINNLANGTASSIASNNVGATIQNNLATASGTIAIVKPNTHFPATDLSYPASDIKLGSGRIVYIDYKQPITRNSNQSEEVRLVIEF